MDDYKTSIAIVPRATTLRFKFCIIKNNDDLAR